MTLIIAQIIDNEVQIISDTQITDQSLGATNPLKGKLKTIIINPMLSISFSGVTYFAEELLKKIYRKQIQNIAVAALEANIKSGDTTHFLICSLHQNRPKLLAVRNRNIQANITAAYIGDSFAYKIYRKYYVESNDSNIFDKMANAFRKVIDDESPDTNTVGQFITIVKTEEAANLPINFLGYQVNHLQIIGKQTLFKKFENTYFLKNVDAFNGGYSFSYLRGFQPSNPAYAIHFHVAAFGVLFYPLKDYLMTETCEPTIFLNQPDGEKFAEMIHKKYNLPMQGLVISDNGLAHKHIITGLDK